MWFVRYMSEKMLLSEYSEEMMLQIEKAYWSKKSWSDVSGKS